MGKKVDKTKEIVEVAVKAATVVGTLGGALLAVMKGKQE